MLRGEDAQGNTQIVLLLTRNLSFMSVTTVDIKETHPIGQKETYSIGEKEAYHIGRYFIHIGRIRFSVIR